ncbi:MAG: hypothetical protein JNK44_11625 [Cyclobacteriaceae bacterium]|nr:hypothetical protein [Cyclobacteriaceae bacterium]
MSRALPYLAMGNNLVIMIDPDGEWAFLAPVAGKIFTKKAIAINLKTGAINVILSNTACKTRPLILPIPKKRTLDQEDGGMWLSGALSRFL